MCPRLGQCPGNYVFAVAKLCRLLDQALVKDHANCKTRANWGCASISQPSKKSINTRPDPPYIVPIFRSQPFTLDSQFQAHHHGQISPLCCCSCKPLPLPLPLASAKIHQRSGETGPIPDPGLALQTHNHPTDDYITPSFLGLCAGGSLPCAWLLRSSVACPLEPIPCPPPVKGLHFHHHHQRTTHPKTGDQHQQPSSRWLPPGCWTRPSPASTR